jgi:hypothetical protein
MTKEDIYTSLRNAVDRGESIESAVRTAINSGYNSKDVNETARYLQRGALYGTQANPEEELTMPNQKKMFFKPGKNPPLPLKKQESSPLLKNQSPMLEPPAAPRPLNKMQNFNQPKTLSNPNNSLMRDSHLNSPSSISQKEKVNPRMQNTFSLKNDLDKTSHKPGWTKEIMLLIILLFLVGLLVVTIIFREKILSFFSFSRIFFNTVQI